MASFVSLAAFGEPVWVSDQFEIMLRTGPSTNNAIELMVSSGTELEFLEEDVESGYSRVMTSGGTEGWIAPSAFASVSTRGSARWAISVVRTVWTTRSSGTR